MFCVRRENSFPFLTKKGEEYKEKDFFIDCENGIKFEWGNALLQVTIPRTLRFCILNLILLHQLLMDPSAH